MRRKRRKHGGALAVCVILAVCLALGFGLVYSKCFVVKRISVVGNETVSYDQIIRQSGLMLGQHISSVDRAAIVNAFARDGDVKLLRIEVEWPDSVRLTVRERHAFAAVERYGVWALVDRYGEVVENIEALPAEHMPVVTGMSVRSCDAGGALVSDVYGQFDMLQNVLDALYQTGLSEQVSEVNLANPEYLYLISRGGMFVVLGDDQGLSGKLSIMVSMLDRLASEGKTTGTLDVSGSNAAVYTDS